MKPLCIYHGNCADGFTAAWAIHRKFGNDFDYHAGVYQDPPPDVTGRDVLLVDFSYKREVLRDMARTARSVLVLDHHKTAADDLFEDTRTGDGPAVMRMDDWTGPLTWERHLGNVSLDQSQGAPCANVYAYFDMGRSGAGIAWDFFHPDTPRPKLIDYVEDRDLWRFALPDSRAVNAWIFSHPYDFHDWDHVSGVVESDFPVASIGGQAIERKHHKDVGELVAALRREMIIGGHWVPVANLPYTLTSDAGHLMCAAYQSPNLQGEIVTPPFAACYWDTPEGRVFSLRSTGEGLDVSEIAKQYGGGGHRNAAGFRLPHGVEP